MRSRRLVLVIAMICLIVCWMFLQLGYDDQVAHAQQSAAGTSDLGVIHVETREVLVDAVVTDKKGNYIRDLAQKDFKAWEDGKEQSITSFSFEESTGSPNNSTPHYIVLFFANSTMNPADQFQATAPAANLYTP